MVISTVASLALYCSHCGKIHTHDVSRFSLKACGQVEISCTCGQMLAKASFAQKGQFFLTVYCELCRKNHVLSIKWLGTCLSELRKLYCMKNNLELGFVGDYKLVEQTLEQHRSAVNRALPDQYTSDAEDSQILLDVLNRIHDIAERGGITCRCGSTAIRAQVLPVCIELRCQACGSYETLSATSETDLSRLESMERIELSLPYHSRKSH